MENWHLINLKGHNPYRNLASEEAIVKCNGAGASPNTICFYRNARSVIIGYFQSVEQEVNQEYYKKHKLVIARRISGGGAVYHDLGNLNYGIITKRHHSSISHDLFKTLKKLIYPIIITINNLGLEAYFDNRSGIFIQNKKISGIASSIKAKTLLCHGTLLVNSKLELINQILNNPKKENITHKYTKSIRQPVTSLSNELQRNVSISEIKKKIQKSFEDLFDIKLITTNMKKDEIELSKELFEKKYSRAEWNFKI